MNLVKIENYKLMIEPEILLLKPFKKLWDNDKTEDKNKFMDFITILFYAYDPRSSYSSIIDEESRLEEVCRVNGMKFTKFTKDQTACIELYKDITTTTSLLLLEDAKLAIEKVRTFLRDVDLTATDDHGKPIYTINSITSAIKQLPQLAKDINTTEEMIAKELKEIGRARGGNERKGPFEEGFSSMYKKQNKDN